MSKLILSLDGKVLKEFPLRKERMTIGRKPSNDIPIENLAVSGEHAVVITILNDSFLEDLASTNGTKVNGNPVKKCFLQNNDVIEIGKYKLAYINEPVEKPAADFEKTRILRPAGVAALIPAQIAPPNPDAAPKPVSRPAPPPAAPAAPPKPQGPQAAIQILSGPSVGRELDLVKNLTTIGKPGVQVAVIARRPNGFFITHVDGPKSPVLNGTPIDLHPHQLNDHDIIELLGIKMEFFIK